MHYGRRMRKADPSLLERMDVRAALETEISSAQRDLLPVQVGDLAAENHLDEVAQIIDTRAKEGNVGTEAAPVLAASKWRHGRRPVAAIPLPERVLYRSAARLLDAGLAKERGKGDFSSFTSAPVENGDDFVIVTDLANFYSSIQIDRLSRVLLSRTGEWSTINWLNDFLHGISPDVGGLPQGSTVSDRLADTYADTLLRRLRRRGLSVWRYSDDFRIGASSYQNAINSLEIFDEEVRSMGLFVNERKTYVMSRDRYVESRGRQHAFLTEAWEQKREELTTVDFYSFEVHEPADISVFCGVALDEMDAWAKDIAHNRDNDQIPQPVRLDLGLALAVVTIAKDPAALVYISDLLLMEPQMAHQVADYLYVMSETHAKAVDNTVIQIIKNASLSKWTSLWLCHGLSNPASEHASLPWGSDDINPEVRDWIRTLTWHNDAVVSSHATWALAINGALTKEDWIRLNSKQGPYSQQYTAATLGKLRNTNKENNDSGDQFDAIVRKWAQSL